MRDSVLIRNGRILDPAGGIDEVGDLVIREGRIASLSGEGATGVGQEVDAGGCLVVPGLVDFHAHLAWRMTDTGVHPDLMAVPNGVTAAVDAGSTGAAAAEAFVADIIGRSEITVKAFLNVSSMGVSTESYPENPDPGRFDAEAIARVFARHPGRFIGLKIRVGKGFTDGLGLRSLRRAKAIAAELGKPTCVHLTRSEFPLAELLDELEGGDILCHCFQSQGDHTVIAGDGRVDSAVLRARERGVIFDAAVGRVNHDFSIMATAFACGFYPDVISTDVVAASLYDRKLFHLLQVMSFFMALGMPLPAVVERCTAAPAGLMGLAGEIGTLAPGARGDIAILRVREKPVRFADQFGHTVVGDRLLVPQATILGGRIAYKQIDFEY